MYTSLFKGLRFFLNRECPRETFEFVIRSFGGEVDGTQRAHLTVTMTVPLLTVLSIVEASKRDASWS